MSFAIEAVLVVEEAVLIKEVGLVANEAVLVAGEIVFFHEGGSCCRGDVSCRARQ